MTVHITYTHVLLHEALKARSAYIIITKATTNSSTKATVHCIFHVALYIIELIEGIMKKTRTCYCLSFYSSVLA